MVVFLPLYFSCNSTSFDGVQAKVVSRPVKNFHLAFPKIFQNHFRPMTSCSIVHEYRSVMHHHMYIQFFLKQLSIFQAIYCGVWGKKIQPSSPMFGHGPSNHLAWECFIVLTVYFALNFGILVFKHASSAVQTAEL